MNDRLPYFRTPIRIDALRLTLNTWSGTRWRHAGTRPNEMQCGVSGDCLFWVHVFKSIGALPANLQIPDYRKREAAMDNMLRLRICIESSERAASCPSCINGEEPFLIGDVLLFRNGMSGAHCGLVVKENPVHFVHLSKNGLLEEPLHQSHWLDNLAFVYRLVEENHRSSACNHQSETDSRELNAERGTSEALP